MSSAFGIFFDCSTRRKTILPCTYGTLGHKTLMDICIPQVITGDNDQLTISNEWFGNTTLRVDVINNFDHDSDGIPTDQSGQFIVSIFVGKIFDFFYIFLPELPLSIGERRPKTVFEEFNFWTIFKIVNCTLKNSSILHFP